MRTAALIMAILLFASPVLAGGPSICFTITDAQKILRAVEKDLPDCRRELYANKIALDNGASEALRECRSASDLYRDRVVELTRERNICTSLLDNTAKAGEKAVKAAKGSWWSRIKTGAMWAAAGAVGLAVVGFALSR